MGIWVTGGGMGPGAWEVRPWVISQEAGPTSRCARVCLHQSGSYHSWLDNLRAMQSTTHGLLEVPQAGGLLGKAV